MAAKQNLKKLRTSSKKVSVKFHREIYKEAAVKEAALAYSGFASFVFSTEGAYLKAVITPVAEALPECLEEDFANRALANSI